MATTTTNEFDAGWERAFARHAESLRRFAARRMRRGEEAEDVVQEAFARVLRRSPALESEAGVRAYLFTTVRNLLANRFRRGRHLLFSELAEPGEEHWESSLEDVSRSSPSDHRLERELDGRFRAALDDLPERQRRAFVEAVLGEKPYRQVAREQGWSVEQVKINVFRARKGLMARLGSTLGEVDS